jgi:hypothetical protein
MAELGDIRDLSTGLNDKRLAAILFKGCRELSNFGSV